MKISMNECKLRYKIILQVFNKFHSMKRKLKKTDPLYEEKKNLITPHILNRFHGVSLFFLISSNIFYFFIMRKDNPIQKYLHITLINFFSTSTLFLILDKKIFYHYVKTPNPYAKFMREEFIKNEEQVSERSKNQMILIIKECNEKYEFSNQ
jgi:hypothetical protein